MKLGSKIRLESGPRGGSAWLRGAHRQRPLPVAPKWRCRGQLQGSWPGAVSHQQTHATGFLGSGLGTAQRGAAADSSATGSLRAGSQRAARRLAGARDTAWRGLTARMAFEKKGQAEPAGCPSMTHSKPHGVRTICRWRVGGAGEGCEEEENRNKGVL